ncbi:DEHA2D00968p [Debaryomyces hansenii CBS767]|uniref:DEHA2D00968p n=1 Tax=Debaryomyces hansenii (strain ATCC 36239 / CBS 767 / BCRC 21394 / JCM 1990 / NBRC 0083 / IGC 2968) TaxID=284592 RepID=Q6BTF8_DEBHA|nr:DEHA2D00968p [Debaryomyces hansenii CBS767]CAG86636.2 DEHA2D00968p [Debaryomyces hansenii CBS767]|eukprot:XP_458511.2 DEHA2D00968p [Debaryomyces hansenii CBS767]
MNRQSPHFNAWSTNPLESRKDVIEALHQQLEPLIPAFTDDGARVSLADTSAVFSMEAAELEGFARPLWGIVPFVYGGGEFRHWDLFRTGLSNGTDPSKPEYWGDVQDYDQHLVELAAIGFALCFVPEHIWNPLSDEAKDNLSKFLLKARENEFPHCNWKFFRIMIDLGLDKVGVTYDKSLTEAYMADIDTMYIDEGWYGDGGNNRIDYYNPFALHFYGMIYYLAMKDRDPERSNKYKSRALLFAKQFIHWFSDDGACIPFGRSCTYRFAVDGFWGMLSCVIRADETPVIPWGVLKGVYLRHLRWWSKQPVSYFKTNILSVGFSYPNQFMCENYNSPQSPYWSLKAFASLILPESHPFWTSKEEPLLLEDVNLKVPGMLISHNKGNTVSLTSGPYSGFIRHHAEKYSKFAYSSRYGFNVENNLKNFSSASLDNMIGFSYNDRDFFFRESNKSWIFRDGLYSEWSPAGAEDIEVKTWILQRGNYHIRVHRVDNNSSEDVVSSEGGFAANVMHDENVNKYITADPKAIAEIETSKDITLILNLMEDRKARVCKAEPNSNLISSKVIVPQLKGRIPAKSTAKFACAVYAQPKGEYNRDKFLESVNVPSEKELDVSKSGAERVTCNIPSNNDELMAKMIKKFQETD